MQSPLHVTIATSSGGLWLALIAHFGTALIALAAGTIAIVVAKGGQWHRKSGTVFTVAMIIAGLFAAGIAIYERKVGSIIGGFFTAYLVFTAFDTVRPLADRRLRMTLMLLAFSFAIAQYVFGLMSLANPKMAGGVPVGMIFFLATITLLAAIGDARLLRAGNLKGARRIARHLWRMCFGLFIATGSFFLGQMKFIPRPFHNMALLLGLAIAPLVLLLYWMWRVRIRKQLRGLIIGRENAASPSLAIPRPARIDAA